MPRISQFDKSRNNLFWNMEFMDDDLQGMYEELPDLARWHISKLLMLERSLCYGSSFKGKIPLIPDYLSISCMKTY